MLNRKDLSRETVLMLSGSIQAAIYEFRKTDYKFHSPLSESFLDEIEENLVGPLSFVNKRIFAAVALRAVC